MTLFVLRLYASFNVKVILIEGFYAHHSLEAVEAQQKHLTLTSPSMCQVGKSHHHRDGHPSTLDFSDPTDTGAFNEQMTIVDKTLCLDKRKTDDDMENCLDDVRMKREDFIRIQQTVRIVQSK